MNQQKLPNALTVLILGIVSIITCCCYGIVSIILGGIGLYLAKKDLAIYNANPSQYADYNNLKIGRILCIIGIILGALYIVYIIVLLATFGTEALSDPELMREQIEGMFNK